ncbi:MAG TPA: hypothetical protein ENJ82_13030 [Bacteroidetes bacterium]|nr:hypothetical protein [Bacteroidota bacterium]
MKNLNLSFTLRACCFMLLTFALVLGTSSVTFGQSRADLKVEFQKALGQLPSATMTGRLSPALQKKINDTRAIYQQGLNIENMNSSQTNSFMSAMSSNTTVVKAAAEPSCVQKCVNEQSACVTARCGNNTTYPCFCCIPCNLVMELCIFDCLVDIEIGIKVGLQKVNE